MISVCKACFVNTKYVSLSYVCLIRIAFVFIYPLLCVSSWLSYVGFSLFPYLLKPFLVLNYILVL